MSPPANVDGDKEPLAENDALANQGDGGSNSRPGVSIEVNGDEQDQPHHADLRRGSVEVVFRSLNSAFWVSLAVLMNVVMIALVFLLPILCDHKKDVPPDGDDVVDSGSDTDDAGVDVCRVSSFSILVYAHCLHWVVHLIVDQRLKWLHKKSRLRGYLEFYIQTKNMRRAPFYLVSFCNAILLLTSTALNDYCDQTHCKNKLFKVDYLRVLITLLCLIVLCCWGNYAINVRDFNKERKKPDILREEARRRLLLCPPSPQEEEQDEGEDGEGTVRRRGGGGRRRRPDQGVAPPHQYVTVTADDDEQQMGRADLYRDEIIELQAELLRYLHSHAEELGAKINALRRRIRQQEYA